MPKEQVTGFCPFAGQFCEGGVIKLEDRSVECQFRVTDTIPSGQCGLFRAIRRLEKLDVMQMDLHILASKGDT